MSTDRETPTDPTERVLLNWTDGKSFLGGSVIRPPKDVWLEERTSGKTVSFFEIEQVFGNLLRRGLAHLGGMTRREVETIRVVELEAGKARSEGPWKVPTPGGMRLRAVYRFRNGSGASSSQLIAHRVAGVDAKAGAGADVGLESLIGAPVGVEGNGEIGVEVQFSVDPVARVSVVGSAGKGSESILDLVRATYDEMAELERDSPSGGLDFDPEQATQAFSDLFSDFLTDEGPEQWHFPESTLIEGDEGTTVELTIRVEAQTPGRSLFAIRVEDIDDPERVAFSDIFALEVDKQRKIRFLTGPAIGTEQIVYQRGTLSRENLQQEIDRMWSSLAEDPELAAAVRASGIKTGNLSEESPFRVLEKVAGIDPGSILLVIAGTVASDLWREVLLPRLRERFGEGAVKRERRRG